MAHSRQHTGKENAADAATTGRQRGPMSKSMHDGVAVWCDCCSCEMEPYWAEAIQEWERESCTDES
ncbi:MAG TPA: hypothetical protein VET88_12395 [Gammaproteobacteria bacterium]|nr:hypothetical protein [Gammaproteobacteria bacterium]